MPDIPSEPSREMSSYASGGSNVDMNSKESLPPVTRPITSAPLSENESPTSPDQIISPEVCLFLIH
jgi:hypothetical protein